MPTTVTFTVSAAEGVETDSSPSVDIEVTYGAAELTEGSRQPTVVPRTTRFPLDARLKGNAVLDDISSPSIAANALAADGATLISKVVAIEGAAASWELDKNDVAVLRDGGQRLPQDVVPTAVTRVARLLPTGEVAADFARSAIGIVPVRDLAALNDTGLTKVLATSDGTRISSLEITGQDTTSVAALPWQPAHLGIDGTITATLTRQKTIGWLWWLVGAHQVIGYMADDLENVLVPPVFLSLPALSRSAVDQPVESSVGDRAIPADVTEGELADNPAIFAEDPGTFCKPFNNPERIVGEKAFFVVARVTQPDIGPIGSAKLRSLSVLQIDGDPTVQPALQVISRTDQRAISGPASVGAFVDRLPVRHPLPIRYEDLLKLLPAGRATMDAQHPLQWEDDMAQYQAATVALGHILEFRVRWRSNGYSLGTVAKTLTLAARQTKRVQKIERQRTQRAERVERTQLRDQVNDSVVHERGYTDAVAAHLDEWASGGSKSGTKAVAGGIGFAIPGLVGGIGGGAGSAYTSSHQEGGRATSASEQQRLQDAIRRHGDALRQLESTVVSEVTEAETVTGTTEVIRNPNYGHALTVIFYQILRHLKVTTEFAGVRECLFVPFAIRPFDIARAYRWRKPIQTYIRSPRYARALRYLKDVATNFSTSDIAPGPRANQELTYLRGSMYISLAVERPADGADGKFDSSAWLVARPMLDSPSLGIFSLLASLAAEQRDRRFQAEYAPAMAARWADRIDIQTGGRTLKTDCTLASRYGFNQTVRVDFSVPADQLAGLTRESLTQLRIAPQLALPPGSVANLTRASFTYSTDRFEHSVEGRTGTNDLIKPVTGAADSATITLPLDTWERVDERLELRRSVDELVEHLNEHVEYYQKAVLWGMDRDRLLMMLDGFYVPKTNNVSIASVVDREPVAIIGNCLVYRVGAASFLGYGKITTPEKMFNLYADRKPTSDPLLVSLPTDGLYAQTVMDECAALEEHYGNTDWVLNDPDPDLGTIDPSLLVSHQTDLTSVTTPTPFPGTIINLQNAPEAPAPAGLAGIIGAVTDANAFRDMAGLAGTQANARAGLEAAAGLATNFGNQAAALEMAKLANAQQATRTADQKLASIKKAKDAGLTSDVEAAEQAKSVLQTMSPGGDSAEPPHKNPAINAAIDAASAVPGSTIEASTGEGSTRVTIGDKADSARRPYIVEVSVSPALRCFGPGTNFTGKTKLSVRGSGLPSGARLKWSVPASQRGRYTITQSTSATGVSEVEISGIRPGVSAIDVEAIDGSTVIQSIKFPLSIPQFITVDDQNPQFDTFITDNNFVAVRSAILDEARAVIQQILLSEANVRLIWTSTGERVPAFVPASLITTVSILNTDPSGEHNFGIAMDGPSAAGVGDTAFDEVVEIYPASLLVTSSNVDLDDATNELVRVVASLQVSDPTIESWIVRIFGRLLGENISHEIYHTLLPVPFKHNVGPDTRDIMDLGSKRSFLERTGIIALSAAPNDFIDNLTDNGRAAIDGLSLPVHLDHIHTHFPIPPVPPFDT